jgi:hypothetical protein
LNPHGASAAQRGQKQSLTAIQTKYDEKSPRMRLKFPALPDVHHERHEIPEDLCLEQLRQNFLKVNLPMPQLFKATARALADAARKKFGCSESPVSIAVLLREKEGLQGKASVDWTETGVKTGRRVSPSQS